MNNKILLVGLVTFLATMAGLREIGRSLSGGDRLEQLATQQESKENQEQVEVAKRWASERGFDQRLRFQCARERCVMDYSHMGVMHAVFLSCWEGKCAVSGGF